MTVQRRAKEGRKNFGTRKLSFVIVMWSYHHRWNLIGGLYFVQLFGPPLFGTQLLSVEELSLSLLFVGGKSYLQYERERAQLHSKTMLCE